MYPDLSGPTTKKPFLMCVIHIQWQMYLMICYDTIELIALKVQLSFEFQRFGICLHNSDEISTHVLLNVCFYDRVRRTFGVVVLIEDVYWDKRRSRDEVLLLVIV